MLFALVPALAAPPDLNRVLKDASSRSGTGRRHNRTLSALVTLEIALAVVLLVGATLLIRTSLALSQVDPGFSASNVLTLKTALARAGYRELGGHRPRAAAFARCHSGAARR